MSVYDRGFFLQLDLVTYSILDIRFTSGETDRPWALMDPWLITYS